MLSVIGVLVWLMMLCSVLVFFDSIGFLMNISLYGLSFFVSIFVIGLCMWLWKLMLILMCGLIVLCIVVMFVIICLILL